MRKTPAATSAAIRMTGRSAMPIGIAAAMRPPIPEPRAARGPPRAGRGPAQPAPGGRRGPAGGRQEPSQAGHETRQDLAAKGAERAYDARDELRPTELRKTEDER